jgi:hypothetical protein
MSEKLINVTLEEAESNRKKFELLFEAFYAIAQDVLTDEDQVETLINCKWSVLGSIDSDISRIKNHIKLDDLAEFINENIKKIRRPEANESKTEFPQKLTTPLWLN